MLKDGCYKSSTAWNIRGQDSTRVESVRMTEINGESTSMVWPALGSRTAKEQNRTEPTVSNIMQSDNWIMTQQITMFACICLQCIQCLSCDSDMCSHHTHRHRASTSKLVMIQRTAHKIHLVRHYRTQSRDWQCNVNVKFKVTVHEQVCYRRSLHWQPQTTGHIMICLIDWSTESLIITKLKPS